MNAEQLGREVEALRQAVARAERDARAANDRIVEVMELVRLMARSAANHQHHLSARLAASIAMVRGEDPRMAYLGVRDRFKAEAPRLYDPMQWGDRPDWLAQLLRDAKPAANDGSGLKAIRLPVPDDVGQRLEGGTFRSAGDPGPSAPGERR